MPPLDSGMRPVICFAPGIAPGRPGWSARVGRPRGDRPRGDRPGVIGEATVPFKGASVICGRWSGFASADPFQPVGTAQERNGAVPGPFRPAGRRAGRPRCAARSGAFARPFGSGHAPDAPCAAASCGKAAGRPIRRDRPPRDAILSRRSARMRGGCRMDVAGENSTDRLRMPAAGHGSTPHARVRCVGMPRSKKTK